MRQSRRIRSGTRCSAKCCTSARRHRRAHSFTGKSALPWNESAPQERRSPPPSWRCISSEAARPMTAVRYYAEAAEAALAHFSPEECMRIIERASPLLEQAPDGPERNALQITIGTLHGLAATRVLGAGSEAKSALQRAYSLLDEAPQHPMRGRLLHGFGFMLCLRAEYAEALAVADRAEALGSTTNDPVLLSTACTVHGAGRSASGSIAGRPDMAGARARRLPSGWTWVPENSWSIRRSRCSACSPSHSLHLGLVEQARACAAARICPRSRSGMADGAARAQSGTARCSRCGSATPSAWPLLPTRCTRSSTNSRSRTVELRVGGFAAGRTPEWAQPRDGLSPDSGGVRRQRAPWNARGRKRGPGLCDRGAVPRRRPGRSAKAARRSAADRRQARRARVSAAALPHAGCDRARARRPHSRRRLDSTRDRGGQSAGGAVAGVDGAD